MSDEKDKKVKNPLFALGAPQKPLNKEEIAAQFAPASSSEPEITEIPQERPPDPTAAFKESIVGQPAQHDMRSDVDYGKRYYKDNVPVDLRLLPYYRHYLRHGGYSKTQSFNKMLVQFLISLNYPIPPDILERPFSFEDLPKDY